MPSTPRADSHTSSGATATGRMSPEQQPRHYVFVLLNSFTLLSFACATEALRVANRMAGRELYSWSLVAEDGASVTCSTGFRFEVDVDLSALNRDDTILVCGGVDVQASST